MMAGLLVGPLPAMSWAWAAAPPADAAEAPAARATALVRQGLALFQQGRYEQARSALTQAYALHPQVETLAELGFAELEAGHPVEAVQHLRQYVEQAGESAEKFSLVRDNWLPRAERQTVQLWIFARDSAEIRVDGIVAPHTPPGDRPAIGEPIVSQVIAPGEHDVSVRDGAFVASQHVVALAGSFVSLPFEGVPLAPVFWDELPPALSPPETRRPGRAPPWIPVIAIESAAVVAAGVGVGFGLAYEHEKSTADGLSAQVGPSGCLAPALTACGPLHADRRAERTDAEFARGFYAGAGAVAVLGAVAWFVWPSPKGPMASTPQPAIVMGPRATEAVLTGAW